MAEIDDINLYVPLIFFIATDWKIKIKVYLVKFYYNFYPVISNNFR